MLDQDHPERQKSDFMFEMPRQSVAEYFFAELKFQFLHHQRCPEIAALSVRKQKTVASAHRWSGILANQTKFHVFGQNIELFR